MLFISDFGLSWATIKKCYDALNRFYNQSSGKSILCEEINFENLQSFLHFDFFNGIRNNYIPNKCKNDPIWQTYNRAYKAHYARYMKKKMTISEFEEWSRFASEIRDKTIAGEIPYDEYYARIRR